MRRAFVTVRIIILGTALFIRPLKYMVCNKTIGFLRTKGAEPKNQPGHISNVILLRRKKRMVTSFFLNLNQKTVRLKSGRRREATLLFLNQKEGKRYCMLVF